MKTLLTLGAVATLAIGGSIPFLAGARAAAPALLAAQDADDPPEEWDATSVREAVDEAYRAWGTARVAYDRETMASMVADDFYVQLVDQRLNGEAFIEAVSRKNPRAPLSRFDVEILSVQPDGDDWRLVIAEKLEWTLTGPDGQARRAYSLWITRDGWRWDGEHWRVTFSEEIGHEEWRDGKPPFEDW